MPRSRHARTTVARTMPGADGIAIVTSSGSTSSRIAAEVARRAEHLDAVDAQPPLERVVVDEADGLEAELGVAQDLAQDEAPAVAGADDEQAARAGARAEAAQRALVDRARDEARARRRTRA